ncbi:MAG: DNA double-strand break repair nuclease NurA [Fervidicoccaceae archaeon]
MSYIDDILEVAARKREEIWKKIRVLGAKEEEAKEIIEKKMISPPLLSSRMNLPHPVKVAAVDGGSFPLSMLGFELYFIKSYAVKFLYESSTGNYVDGGESRIVDVDVLIPPSLSQDRITVYRQISELRAMNNSLDSGFLTLADGSIESLISRPAHMKLRDLRREDESLCHKALELIQREEREDTAIAVKGFIERELGNEPERAKTLEMVEKAVRIKMLFEKISEGRMLAFVTKTGRSNRLFNLPIPDQYVLTKLTMREGYIVEGKYESFEEAVGEELTELCGLKESAENLSFISGYARLYRGAPVLKVQLLSPKMKGSSLDALFEDLVLKLASLSSEDGYPFPLLIAHQRAHIEKRITAIVADALGLREELSGREEIDVL